MFTKTNVLGAVLAVAFAAAVAKGQTVLQLDDMSGVRGLICQGQLGVSGPPLQPIKGDLGRTSALVDLNGDGFDDLVVGAPLLPTSPGTGVLDDAGHAYILFGSGGSGLPGSSPDFTFASYTKGQAIDLFGDPGDHAGAAVAAVGDVDGDGFQDVAIGAPNHTIGNRTAAGGAYLVFGRSDLKTLNKSIFLSVLAAGADNRAVFLQGAHTFGSTGSALAGGVDCDHDGFEDVILGSPLDSTNGHSQNGTATVFYGRPALGASVVIDLATQGAGEVTVVHGSSDFQFMGFSVAGVGKFDPILPMTNNAFNLFFGDDVAIGAPGTTVGAEFLAGSIYVLRGIASGTPAVSYTADDFGNGPNKAGIVYTGEDPGDQLGFWVASAGDVIKADTEGFEDFLATAPFNDGVGKPDSGSIYVLSGRIVGQNPQGFDVGLLGQGLQNVFGIHIQGAVTAGGQQGVWATNAGDWNGDGLPDIAVGFPNVATFDGAVWVSAGRARILDGLKVLFSLGTVDLADPFAGYDLLQVLGEAAGAYAGSGLSAGDFNGDGASDLAVGAFGAPSDPSPFDATGLAHLKTGRVHVVYGPVLRLESVSPSSCWFGGPAVTVTALNVPASGVAVEVDGVPATVTSFTSGDSGTITFAPPPPVATGALADVLLDTSSGDVTYENLLQFVPLAVTGGAKPDTGFAGSSVAFTGQSFSTVADTTVTVQGFPATVTAVDGLAGTMTIILPSGPPLGSPADVVITNSNGSVTLLDDVQYLPVGVQSITPTSGVQYSGVFSAGAVPYPGEPPTSLQLIVLSSIGPIPADPLVEFGTPVLGYRTAKVTAVNGTIITCELPPFLLGPQTVVDVKVSFNGGEGVLAGGFTYLESDFQELNQYAQAGFGSVPPRALMAGQFTNFGLVLFQADQLPPQMQLTVLVLGLDLVDPPLTIKGGPFPIDLGLPFYVFLFPFPGLPSVSISQAMPTNIDPVSDGVPLYIHVLTKEKSGGATKWGFSNVLQMTIDV